MKKYIRTSIFIAAFALVMFFGGAKNADAFSINLGFGSYNTSGYYPYGGYGYNVPVNCFNSGYPCNGYYGGNTYGYGYNYGNYGNYGYNYGSYGYGTNCGYNCYNYPYTMSSPTYYSSNSYYDYYPTRTYGGYTGSNMYSTWYGY